MEVDSSLVFKARSSHSDLVAVSVTREEAAWRYISFAVWRLPAGQTVADETRDEEIGLVVLSGTLSIDSTAGSWPNIGRRSSVFDGNPFVLYLPPGTACAVRAVTDCLVARCGSLASNGVPAYLVSPDEIAEEVRGEGNAQRTIRQLLGADRPAEHLFLVECITPSGKWSSYPPHKHDTDAYPNETYLEEIYYHRLRPPQGFGIQRVYTLGGAQDEVVVVQEGTVVAVRAGYHPVVVAPGYDLYYLNVMAGPIRQWRFTDDPDHAWVAEAWTPYGGDANQESFRK